MITEAQLSIILPSLAILGVFLLVLATIVIIDILKNRNELVSKF